MEFKELGQAEWDGRQNFMLRLHHSIMFAHTSMFNNDYEGWYKALIVLKIELSSHMRTTTEKEDVSAAMARMKSALYNGSGLSKMEGFIAAQESLFVIIRNRGFDVPINERDPGKLTR